MVKSALSLALVFGCAASVGAQDYLLPTHVSAPGEINISAELRYQAGEGTLSNPSFEVDFEETHVLGLFRFGVGIGSGFEIEASAPFEFSGTGEADESGVEFEVETAGLGDLMLEGNYLISPMGKDAPQVLAGLVVVLPTGNDDFATPEIRVGGVEVQQGEEGGLGQGVFKIGVQFGVSQKVTGAHIYGAARFLVSTGTQDQDDLEIDHPDVFSLLAGAMIPLGETSNLDIRLNLNYLSDEVAEDDFGDESTEEAHFNVNLEPRFYFTVGSTATIILGGSLGWQQDHAVDEEAELDLEQVFTYGVTLGLHLRLGVPLVGGARR